MALSCISFSHFEKNRSPHQLLQSDAELSSALDLNFTIGDDNNEALKGGMMMSAPIMINGVPIASLALVGPKRIDYANVAAALKFIVNQLNNIKGGKD